MPRAHGHDAAGRASVGVLPSDHLSCSTGALLFSLGLGMSSVALPLLALAHGHDATMVGLMVTFCALVQIAARLSMGPLMRRVSDKHILVASAVAQAACFGLVLVTTELWALFASWALQGIGRAGFWTCGQTHMVREDGIDSVRALAHFNFFGSGGQCLGPLAAGVLAERGLDAALAAGVLVSLASLVPMARLVRTPPFERVATGPGGGRMWRFGGVKLACWAGVGAGAWRSIMDSFVPVVLKSAQHSSGEVGLLVTVANGAAVAGALLVGRTRGDRTTGAYRLAMLLTGAGMVGFALAASSPLAVIAVCLVVAGVAAGALQTIGPSLAAISVHPQRRGEVIALAGTFRTSAMFLAPLGISSAVALALPVTAAIAGASLLYALVVGQRGHLGTWADA